MHTAAPDRWGPTRPRRRFFLNRTECSKRGGVNRPGTLGKRCTCSRTASRTRSQWVMTVWGGDQAAWNSGMRRAGDQAAWNSGMRRAGDRARLACTQRRRQRPILSIIGSRLGMRRISRSHRRSEAGLRSQPSWRLRDRSALHARSPAPACDRDPTVPDRCADDRIESQEGAGWVRSQQQEERRWQPLRAY